jgi:hypothetical protein
MTPWSSVWGLLLLAVSAVVLVAGVMFSTESWGVAMAIAGGASTALCMIGLVLRQAAIAFLGSLVSGCGGLVGAALASPDSTWASPALTAGLLGVVGLGLLGATRMLSNLAGAERTDRIGVILGELYDTSMLSDIAKRILYRDREMGLIRNAIEEDIERGDFNSGLVLCGDLERLFGYTEAAEQLRHRVLLARNSQLAARIASEVADVNSMIDAGELAEADVAGQRLQRMYPDSPSMHGLEARIRAARLQAKRDLKEAFLGAASRGDTRLAMQLLRDLDHDLTATEAVEIREVAAETVSQYREALSARFKMAVSDHRWAEAATVGEQIVDEFPNDRMATEVREMLGRLNERAEAENAEAKK